jgi:hypothetical protein
MHGACQRSPVAQKDRTANGLLARLDVTRVPNDAIDAQRLGMLTTD